MIAGSTRGILKSVDGGENWFLQELNAVGSVTAITFDPNNELTVYLGAGGIAGGLYKSTNGGATWTNPLSWRNVYTVAIDPAHPDVVYVGAHADSLDAGGLLKSTDSGSTWTTVLPNVDVSSVVVDPADPRRIYAGAADGVIYNSPDGGTTWKKATGSTIVAPVTALSFDPQNHVHLFAATGGQGVFYSADSGMSWSTDNQGLSDLNIVSMAIQTASPYMVLAVTYGGNGFWAEVPTDTTPPPTPTPTPSPAPTPSPSPTPTPTQTLTPSPTPAPTPTPSPTPVRPLPAQSPTWSGHMKKRHVVAPNHKTHKHSVITHHKHKAIKHARRSARQPNSIWLGQVLD